MEEDLLMLLPEEILVDIASRLTAKDACRLKCSSKPWLSLISSSSDFKKLHRRRAAQRPPVLVLAKLKSRHFVDDQMWVRDFSPPKLNCNVHLVLLLLTCPYHPIGSCRDLMCFCDYVYTYVYNPLTMEYLRFHTRYLPSSSCDPKIGLVYVDSLRLYKLVKFQFYPVTATVRFESVTLVEEDGRVGRVYRDDNVSRNEWELICEHTLPLQNSCHAVVRNLIGVNGIVYAIVMGRRIPYEDKVVSLSFEDDKEQQFKIFNLPKVAKCHLNLSRVKDILCVPYKSDSTIDLWLLEDRNTGIWSKGYTISYSPPGQYGTVDQVVYLPHPTTIDDDDDDADDGLFLFAYEDHLYQYDIRTKEGLKLLPDKFCGNLHLCHDNLVSLKDAARCTLIPKLSCDSNSPELEEKQTTTTPLYSTWFLSCYQPPPESPPESP